MKQAQVVSIGSARESQSTPQPVPGSYRDPAGFVFFDRGLYKRFVTQRGLEDYERYVGSGLHRDLVRDRLVLDHREEPPPFALPEVAKVLVPEQVPFISYPYEWSFDQLKDAALLTLDVAERALARGMILKDAAGSNVQFRGSRPVFIDTLSFTKHTAGPWVAYEQFCRQFLAPLLLARYGSPGVNQELKVHLDGFPLGEASRRLPRRTCLRPGALLHIHLHARAGARTTPAGGAAKGTAASSGPLIASLRRTVEKLRAPREHAPWVEYYAESRFYSDVARESKLAIVREMAAHVRPRSCYDLGANTGLYARLLADTGADCVAFERDPACVNRLYVDLRNGRNASILPLVMDLANPSPGLGFGLNSTLSLFDRPQSDMVLALALIHHLRIGANLPFRRIASFLSRLGRYLLVEFVPFDDPAVATLTQREADFADYNFPQFLAQLEPWYHLRCIRPIQESLRQILLFERKG